MRDIEPDEMAKRLWVQEKVIEVIRRYGFKMMDPTPIENLKTLEAKSGPSIRKEIYWFKDKSGRPLGLRFDLTVGMTRLVANRFDLPEPIKLAALGGQWRYDEPQFARYRYFHQWDAEIYGVAEPIADAEAIALSIDILENVGLTDFEVRISNRRLIQKLLEEKGVRIQQKLEAVFRVVDKMRKISEARLLKELKALKLKPAVIEAIRHFASQRGPPAEVLGSFGRILGMDVNDWQGFKELQQLVEGLEGLGKLQRCIYDLSIVRGIGYYDGIVFEGYDRVGEDIGSIFGGGRYDKLCSLYGKRDMPATGVAGGIERMLLSLERAGVIPKSPVADGVFVAFAGNLDARKRLSFVARLRSHGVSADYDLKAHGLGKQLEYADAARFAFAMIVGPREMERGMVKLRDMISRTEREMGFDEALSMLKR
jgi:histidyl-tRNA synthetase